MNVEEDIQQIENKTKSAEYTPMYFLHEQERRLEEMERAVAAIQNISESTLKALERQRTIVKALIIQRNAENGLKIIKTGAFGIQIAESE